MAVEDIKITQIEASFVAKYKQRRDVLQAELDVVNKEIQDLLCGLCQQYGIEATECDGVDLGNRTLKRKDKGNNGS